MISLGFRRTSATAVSNLRSRLRTFTAMGHDPSVQLFSYAICPFCSKVKALLSFAGLSKGTQFVEVNPLTKSEIKDFNYKKVPIAVINDKPIFDSNNILNALLDDPSVEAKIEQKFEGANMTIDIFRSEEAQKWIRFADEDLAVLLYPNICRTLSDSYQAFGYVDNVTTFSTWQRLSVRTVGSLAMYMAASRVKKKRNIQDERAALEEVLSDLESSGLKNPSGFISGADVPDLGDLAVYGTLRSIEGLPAHDEFVRQRQGLVSEWYSRMSSIVETK